jgi:hypothetical protein
VNYDYPSGLKRHRPYLALPLAGDSIAYVNIARCACRTMRVAMCNLRADGRLIDWLPRGAERKQYYRIFYGDTARLRARARGVPTFTFVRNPYDRLISFYLRRRSNITGGFYDAAGIGDRLDPARAGPDAVQEDFAEFVRRFVTIPFQELDNHAIHQNLFIRDRDGVFVDFVGKLETVREQWPRVEAMAGRTIPLLHIVEARSPGAVRPRYTPETQRLVHDYYRSDFELLDYSCEIDDVAPGIAGESRLVARGYSVPPGEVDALRRQIAERGGTPSGDARRAGAKARGRA